MHGHGEVHPTILLQEQLQLREHGHHAIDRGQRHNEAHDIHSLLALTRRPTSKLGCGVCIMSFYTSDRQATHRLIRQQLPIRYANCERRVGVILGDRLVCLNEGLLHGFRFAQSSIAVQGALPRGVVMEADITISEPLFPHELATCLLLVCFCSLHCAY